MEYFIGFVLSWNAIFGCFQYREISETKLFSQFISVETEIEPNFMIGKIRHESNIKIKRQCDLCNNKFINKFWTEWFYFSFQRDLFGISVGVEEILSLGKLSELKWCWTTGHRLWFERGSRIFSSIPNESNIQCMKYSNTNFDFFENEFCRNFTRKFVINYKLNQ